MPSLVCSWRNFGEEARDVSATTGRGSDLHRWIGTEIIGLKDFSTKDLWLGLNFEVRAPSAVVLAYRTRNSIKFGDG